jgi:hypothetical protein
VLAAAVHDLLERPQLARGRVGRDHLALQDHLARPQALVEQVDHVRELATDPLQAAGEQLDLAVGGAVGLDPDAVVLVLGRARPAELGQQLRGVAHPLGEHRPHRVARADLDGLDRLQAPVDQGGRDQAEVGADVVGPLQHRPAGPAAGVDQGQGVQDGRVADPQP